MINNKQVNVWRGDTEPPTIYHVWIYNNTKMLLYNETKWVVFIDDAGTIERINSLIERVDVIDDRVKDLEEKTINSYPIIDNPVLTGSDIQTNISGTYIKTINTLAESLSKLDQLLTTQIIE